MFLAQNKAVTAKKYARINTALIFVAAFVLIFAASIYRVGLEVIMDGESIGYVSSQNVVEDSLSVASGRAEEILGRAVLINPDITYRFSVVSKNKLFDAAGVEAELLTSVPDIERLCVLTIDDVVIAASKHPSDIQTVLDDILAEYPSDGQLSFYQDVSIQSRLAPVSLIRRPEELKEILAYKSARGIPLLSVVHIEQISYSVPVSFGFEYVEDSTIYMGVTKTVSPGVNGEALVIAQKTSIDGVETERVVTGQLLLFEPVAELVATGTRERSNTGTFIRPASGPMTSGYGWRVLRGVGGFHYGFDYKGDRGDPIYAADGGTVVFVGWRNGFGMTVVVDHENGYQTLYAHCSKYLVEVGQVVVQGERIAEIGSTGRSYGNHLHFEIHVDGVAKNPIGYGIG
jgi:hypothetical protein